ncbi:MAG: hypothetical protein IKM21_00055 [Oscillospiraceae bacterium]|nr:hypothetical protein [Oscillospiraceae bacterium]
MSSEKVYTKTYKSFLGVDFSKDASMVDDVHSPDAENIISDLDGFPEKRVGWRVLQTLDGRINGIFSFGDRENPCAVVHAGNKIYKVKDDIATEVYTDCTDERSCGKYFRGKLCILTGREFLVFDGEKCYRAAEDSNMYAPITHIQRISRVIGEEPRESTEFELWWEKGTFPFEDQPGCVPEVAEINLVSGRRKNTFEWEPGNSWSVNLFILDAKIDPGSRVIMRYIPTGEVLFDVTYSEEEEYSKSYYSLGTSIVGNEHPQLEGINTDCIYGIKTTSSNRRTYLWLGNSEKNNCGFVACSVNPAGLTGYIRTPGVDDFSIEFAHAVEGYSERIEKCRFMDVFENRVFFSGNPDYPNVDWCSGVNDPFFVPDINYTEIGLSSSEIMGYLRTGSEQAIIKSDGDGATIYMRSYQMLSDGKVIFPIKQGIGGVGAVSNSMTAFLDDPIFLTRNGVYAIAQQDISSERALNIRSTRVNSRLLSEKNLRDAQMCEWNGYLLLGINGKCFVADAAKKSYSGNKTGTFEYEWYYWTNIPATSFGIVDGELLFGTEDGHLCRFNNDMVTSRGELSSRAYSDDGAAICARWATPLSDDGDFMRLKTMVKSGSGIFLKTYNRSGVSVCIRTDSGAEKKIKEQSAGVFNFEDIDFSDFTFNTSPYTVVPFNTRIKKYKAVQVICRNDKVNQAFGIGGIVRKFFYGKTNK